MGISAIRLLARKWSNADRPGYNPQQHHAQVVTMRSMVTGMMSTLNPASHDAHYSSDSDSQASINNEKATLQTMKNSLDKLSTTTATPTAEPTDYPTAAPTDNDNHCVRIVTGTGGSDGGDLSLEVRVVSESAFDLGTEAWPAGFCMSNAIDQNNGVTKLEGGNYEGNTKEAQCLAQCKEHSADWTGCEVIWDQSNRGCYVHTEHVNYANNVDKHKCLLREVYDAAVPAEQTGCALNECRPGGSYTGTYSFTDFIGDPSGCTTTYCDQYLLGGQFHSRCTAAAGTDARGYADAECLGTCQGLCISNTDVDTAAVMPPPSPPSI